MPDQRDDETMYQSRTAGLLTDSAGKTADLLSSLQFAEGAHHDVRNHQTRVKAARVSLDAACEDMKGDDPGPQIVLDKVETALKKLRSVYDDLDVHEEHYVLPAPRRAVAYNTLGEQVDHVLRAVQDLHDTAEAWERVA